MSQTQKYYEAQLKLLREEGKIFANKHPKLAPLLAEGDVDPDIERLLEGFAFISGKLWHKIDDAYPEISEQLLEFVAPNYLKPLPSCTILEFLPKVSQAGIKLIPRGTRIDAAKQAHYFFSTSYDTHVLPMTIKSVFSQQEYDALILRLDFSMLGAMPVSQLPDTLRLYFSTDLTSAYWWYYLLLKQCAKAIFYVDDQVIPLENLQIDPVGFGAECGLNPYAADHHLTEHLLEYYSFPEKFMFVDLKNLPWQRAPYAKNFSLEFYLKAPPRLKLNASLEHFKINCTPIINLWEHHAAPIVHDHTKRRYFVNIPETELKAAVHSVISLDVWSHEARARYDYHAAYRCPFPHKNINRYQVYLEEAVAAPAPKMYLELWEGELNSVDKITIVPQVLAYQPEVFLALQQGDIDDHAQSLLNCGYKNVSTLSMPVYPPLGSKVSWHLLCYLAMAYKNLDELDNLRASCNIQQVSAFIN